MEKKIFIFWIALLLCSPSLAQGDWITQYENSTAGELYDVCFINSLEGYAVGSSGLVLKTTNRGASWETVPSGRSDHLQGVAAKGNNVWAVTSTGSSGASSDGGGTWDWSNSAAPGVTVNDIWFVDDNNGFAVSLNGNVFSTTNAGQSWSSTIPFIGFAQRAVHGTATNNVWIGGASGITHRWDGSSWNLSALGNNQFRVDGIHAIDTTNVWAVGLYYPLAPAGNAYKTTDGGTNWTNLTIGTSTPDLADIWFIDSNTGWAISNDGVTVVWYTTDGGTNWATQEIESTAYIHNAIFFADEINGWVVGGAGQNSAIYKYTLLPEITTITPTNAAQGSTENIIISGANFQGGANASDIPTVSLGAGITVNTVTHNSTTELIANISISSSASSGARSITVINPDLGSGSASGLFSVQATPTTTTSTTTTTIATTTTTTTATTTTTIASSQTRTAAPQYTGASDRWWHPEDDGMLAVHVEAETAVTDATLLITGAPHPDVKRKISLRWYCH